MADRYASFAHSGPGRAVIRRLGLPDPPKLHRHRPGEPLVSGPVLLDGAPGGRVGDAVAKLLAAAGVELAEPAPRPLPDRPRLYAGLVFDATGITDPAGLRALYDFFHPYLRSLYPNGRVVVLGTEPAAADGAAGTAAQQALEGFTRSLAKELRRGATGQLVQIGPGAEQNLESTLRFLLSARSAYVTGQVLQLQAAPVAVPADWDRPLAGKIALVTGAAGGIGAATAQVLARDGAQLVCLDLAAAGDALAAVTNQVGGTAVQLDLTASEAPGRLAEHLAGRFGRVDVVAHVAGITRDRTLARMQPDGWDQVLEVNLAAVARATEALLAAELVPDGGRLVAVSSVSGIAGNRGQTNYGASKAGLVGLVRGLAGELAGRRVTANAVAPGFIETPMTAQMPRVPRELARRLNSLAQAGQPVDVAEAIAWLASPGSGGVTGQVLRVCGQSLLGA
ncbi:MAG: 3-oxoacyl-ACP reductase [Micromonosporaceae bacterium]|nr:3-oxoacyl-ACP reductase [Micromonosporaceae bacterium]